MFVHVKVVEPPEIGKESMTSLQDAGVYITLSSPINKSFYLASRNSPPESRGAQAAPQIPFSVESTDGKRRPTAYLGAGKKLTVTFSQRIVTEPAKAATDSKKEPQSILDTAGAFSLVPCNNNITLGVSPDAYEDAGEKDKVEAALQKSIGEIEALIKPVFFQEGHQVLFIEPDVTERTVEQWEEWVTRTPVVEPEGPGWHKDPRFWEEYLKPLYPIPSIPDLIGPRRSSRSTSH